MPNLDPKRITLQLDRTAQTPGRIRIAIDLAERFDAQVTGYFDATPSLLRYPLSAEGGTAAVGILMEMDAQFRSQAKSTFERARAESTRLFWGDTLDFPDGGVLRHSFYADLMILGQREPDDPLSNELPGDYLSHLLIGTGKPGLIIPYIGETGPIGNTVLIAWKETREAARAVSAALPWLVRADTVHVICYGENSESSLLDLKAYLKGYGVEATLHGGGPEQRNAGEMLLSRAADLRADLLVMGCYGHSRTREFVLGGASRTILQSMTLPVLMAH